MSSAPCASPANSVPTPPSAHCSATALNAISAPTSSIWLAPPPPPPNPNRISNAIYERQPLADRTEIILEGRGKSVRRCQRRFALQHPIRLLHAKNPLSNLL